jgi:hypothetical protein
MALTKIKAKMTAMKPHSRVVIGGRYATKIVIFAATIATKINAN